MNKLEGFAAWILETHPDPDNLMCEERPELWSQFCKLADKYAEVKASTVDPVAEILADACHMALVGYVGVMSDDEVEQLQDALRQYQQSNPPQDKKE